MKTSSVISLLFIGAALALGYIYYPTPFPADRSTVQIGELTIPVEIADDPPEQTRGLSGRETLAEDSGLLFVFDRADRYRFWMPDMRFSIDIIWINNGQVVDITRNASHIFDPQAPVFYVPSTPARYVLEVNSGFADKNRLKVGDPIKILVLPLH